MEAQQTKPMYSTLTNKRILLGVTGGIAAYKSADLVRRLQDAGASVRVVMTRASQEFITPLTMQALSGNPVHTDLLDPAAEAAMGHIELARWADLVLVAPASANFIAQLCAGEGNDLLQTLCLATSADIAIAPAMNQGMWANEATQNNMETLRNRGTHIFGPASGLQACGDVGVGRMLEVADIVVQAASLFASGVLTGKTVVLTAGPTREAIDPVRYISNHSSGKMGYALAQAAVDAGAKVLLISGPVSIAVPERVQVEHVQSAQQMFEAVHKVIAQADVFIGTAAVADFRPAKVEEQKIKKQADSDTMTISLVKNLDILASVTQLENAPFTVGFAAETESLLEHAKEKLARKNLRMVVANDVSDATIGFNSDDNAATILLREEKALRDIVLSRRSKTQLAREIVQIIAKNLKHSE